MRTRSPASPPIALPEVSPEGGTLRRLGQRECLALLQMASIGRVMFVAAGFPRAQPAAFTMHDGAILLTTSRDGALAAAVRNGGLTTFEIDESHLRRRTGWSVLVTGVASPVDPADGAAVTAAGRVRPWVAGHDQVAVRLPCTRVSGRVVIPRPSGVRRVA
jgi:nitroimidazol reductase NimA-like FMN-containing flavoprotein (pyridoxamine 5'-phosphate oxidase superfamily)